MSIFQLGNKYYLLSAPGEQRQSSVGASWVPEDSDWYAAPMSLKPKIALEISGASWVPEDSDWYAAPMSLMPKIALEISGDQELTEEDGHTNLLSKTPPLEHGLSDADSLDFVDAEPEAGPSGMPGCNRFQDPTAPLLPHRQQLC
ncbi:uncharacterized protein LOC144762687 [Lissotriton helveticus]